MTDKPTSLQAYKYPAPCVRRFLARCIVFTTTLVLESNVARLCLFLIFAQCLSVQFAFSQTDAEASTSDPRITHALELWNLVDGTVFAELELGEFRQGSVCKARVEVTNKLGSSIEFKKAVVSCSCTTALVPQIKLESKESAVMVFELSISSKESFPAKEFDVNIASTGIADRIVLKLKSKISDVVAFADREIFLNQRVDNTEEPIFRSKSVQLHVSSIDILEGAKIQFSKELEAVKATGEISVRGKEASLNVRIPISDQLEGTVTVIGEKFPPRTLPVVIQGSKRMTVSPRAIVFVSKDTLINYGTAIVRFDRSIGSKLAANKQLPHCSAKLPNGNEIATTLSRLTSEIYRIEFQINKDESMEYEGKWTDIELRFDRPSDIDTEKLKVKLP